MQFSARRFASFDWLLGLSVFVLVILGLSAQYGITLSDSDDVLSTFSKQLVALCVGLVGAMAIVAWNYRLLQSYAGALYAAGVVLLGLVLAVGVTRRGTTGWFDLGFVDAQPIEFAKVALVVALAAILARRKTRRVGWRHLIATAVPVGIYSFLVMWQPDMGSAALMVGAWGILLVVAGLRRKILIGLGAVAVVALLAGWFVFFQEFQRDRLLTFLAPDRDPLGDRKSVV